MVITWNRLMLSRAPCKQQQQQVLALTAAASLPTQRCTQTANVGQTTCRPRCWSLQDKHSST
jgi:hypothetical protein